MTREQRLAQRLLSGPLEQYVRGRRKMDNGMALQLTNRRMERRSRRNGTMEERLNNMYTSL